MHARSSHDSLTQQVVSTNIYVVRGVTRVDMQKRFSELARLVFSPAIGEGSSKVEFHKSLCSRWFGNRLHSVIKFVHASFSPCR